MQNRFMKTQLWLELKQFQEFTGIDCHMRQVIVDTQLCGALFEVDLKLLKTDGAHLEFIDLDLKKSLWVEMQFSPHKLLETLD